MRYLAHFTPQAWVHDRAVTCDSQGVSTWDVTEHLLTLPLPERVEATQADDYGSDSLRDLPHAPAWARDWSGPFYVAVRAEAETDADRALLRLCTDSGETFAWELVRSDAAEHTFREVATGEETTVAPLVSPRALA